MRRLFIFLLCLSMLFQTSLALALENKSKDENVGKEELEEVERLDEREENLLLLKEKLPKLKKPKRIPHPDIPPMPDGSASHPDVPPESAGGSGDGKNDISFVYFITGDIIAT